MDRLFEENMTAPLTNMRKSMCLSDSIGLVNQCAIQIKSEYPPERQLLYILDVTLGSTYNIWLPLLLLISITV
jgi:hypothetical protein